MKQQLVEALGIISKLQKDSPVLIEVRSDKLFVGTYTANQKVVYETSYKHEPFRAVISTEMSKILPEVASDEFSVDEHSLTFKNGKDKTVISLLTEGINLSELAKGYEKDELVSVDGEELRNAFEYTRHAANDKSIGDVVFRGFHLNLKPDVIEVVATNGAILSLVKVKQNRIEYEESEVLLLNSEFYGIAKSLDSEYPVSIAHNENSVSVTQKTGSYTVRFISAKTKGTPLDYSTVMKNAKSITDITYVVDKQSFLSSLRQVRHFSEGSVTLSFYNTGEFTLDSSSQSGEVKREVSVKSFLNENDKNISINTQSELLFRYIASVKAEYLSIHLKGESTPLFLEDGFGEEVIAPLRA